LLRVRGLSTVVSMKRLFRVFRDVPARDVRATALRALVLLLAWVANAGITSAFGQWALSSVLSVLLGAIGAGTAFHLVAVLSAKGLHAHRLKRAEDDDGTWLRGLGAEDFPRRWAEVPRRRKRRAELEEWVAAGWAPRSAAAAMSEGVDLTELNELKDLALELGVLVDSSLLKHVVLVEHMGTHGWSVVIASRWLALERGRVRAFWSAKGVTHSGDLFVLEDFGDLAWEVGTGLKDASDFPEVPYRDNQARYFERVRAVRSSLDEDAREVFDQLASEGWSGTLLELKEAAQEL
jgi:hypothetical protein